MGVQALKKSARCRFANRSPNVAGVSGNHLRRTYLLDRRQRSSARSTGASHGEVLVISSVGGKFRSSGGRACRAGTRRGYRRRGSVVMDSDLQDDPAAIRKMLAAWRTGIDVVYAVREKRKEAWWKRALFAGFHRLLAQVSTTPIPADAGNFSLIDARAVRQIVACGSQRSGICLACDHGSASGTRITVAAATAAYDGKSASRCVACGDWRRRRSFRFHRCRWPCSTCLVTRRSWCFWAWEATRSSAGCLLTGRLPAGLRIF